jgi:hypothetical protein
MVIVLYVAAAVLVFFGFFTNSPFIHTDLIITAAVCFLLARFIRIERRLDKIEGISHRSTSIIRRAWLWAIAR